MSVFKHQVRVDIREFYLTDDGQRKPGKKGISLSKKEWEALKDKMDDIEKAIKENDSDSVCSLTDLEI